VVRRIESSREPRGSIPHGKESMACAIGSRQSVLVLQAPDRSVGPKYYYMECVENLHNMQLAQKKLVKQLLMSFCGVLIIDWSLSLCCWCA
jgi:hypothetical protein